MEITIRTQTQRPSRVTGSVVTNKQYCRDGGETMCPGDGRFGPLR